MLLEHERNYDLGMAALVTVCSWNTNGVSPGTWRTRSQTPSIPLNNLYSSPLSNPPHNPPFRSLDYSSIRHSRLGNFELPNKFAWALEIVGLRSLQMGNIMVPACEKSGKQI